VFLLLLLPVTCQLKGLTLAQLPAYLTAGGVCLMGGSPPCGADCAGAPLLPLLYVAVNVVSVCGGRGRGKGGGDRGVRGVSDRGQPPLWGRLCGGTTAAAAVCRCQCGECLLLGGGGMWFL